MKRFSLDETKIIIAEVILAINFCHENLNLIYRDLRTDNIFVLKNGHIKLGDIISSK